MKRRIFDRIERERGNNPTNETNNVCETMIRQVMPQYKKFMLQLKGRPCGKLIMPVLKTVRRVIEHLDEATDDDPRHFLVIRGNNHQRIGSGIRANLSFIMDGECLVYDMAEDGYHINVYHARTLCSLAEKHPEILDRTVHSANLADTGDFRGIVGYKLYDVDTITNEEERFVGIEVDGPDDVDGRMDLPGGSNEK